MPPLESMEQFYARNCCVPLVFPCTRIHYPLALPYAGKPDPVVLQDTVRRLHSELEKCKKQVRNDYRSCLYPFLFPVFYSCLFLFRVSKARDIQL